MTTMVSMLLAGALFLGPLLWRIWADERSARAEAIAADVRAAISRRFHGDTYLTVHVTPPSLRRAGTVTLSVPGGYEWLLEESWRDAMSQIPAGYDLALKASGSVAPRIREAWTLPRAA